MELTGRQLLIILELHAVHHGSVCDIGYIECSTDKHKDDDPLEALESMKLIKIGPRKIDQAEPVRLTRAGKRIANAMVDAAEGVA